MSNKLIKNLSLIFVMLITFFGFTNNVLGAEKLELGQFIQNLTTKFTLP